MKNYMVVVVLVLISSPLFVCGGWNEWNEWTQEKEFSGYVGVGLAISHNWALGFRLMSYPGGTILNMELTRKFEWNRLKFHIGSLFEEEWNLWDKEGYFYWGPTLKTEFGLHRMETGIKLHGRSWEISYMSYSYHDWSSRFRPRFSVSMAEIRGVARLRRGTFSVSTPTRILGLRFGLELGYGDNIASGYGWKQKRWINATIISREFSWEGWGSGKMEFKIGAGPYQLSWNNSWNGIGKKTGIGVSVAISTRIPEQLRR